ncbi:MAG: lactoylglutathione lyase [bacterium]
MAKLIHAMFRVLDLDRSIQFYSMAFLMQESHRLDFSGFTLVYLRDDASGMEIELTLNKGTSEPYELGNGYGHVAFVVDDLEATHARFVKQNLEPKDIVDFAPDDHLIARFFFCNDPDGYSIEVLQRHGHYQ